MNKKFCPSEEFRLIDTIKRFSNYIPSRRIPLGIGDDAAVLAEYKDEHRIVTTDTCVQDVHFSLDYMSLVEVGYKAMVTNLSDCAAMGAIPDAAFVNLVFPASQTDTDLNIRSIYRGFNRACKRWAFPIIGGDLSSGPCWMIAITLVGRLHTGEKPLLRSGGQDGDRLWVTGTLGYSAAGLAALQKWGRGSPARYRRFLSKHLAPIPRIEAGRLLVKTKGIHAVMDLSDGLSKDAATMAHESKVGIVLDKAALAPTPLMRGLADSLGTDPVAWILHGGEEYELLISARADLDLTALLRQVDLPCYCVGNLDRRQKALMVVEKERYTSVMNSAWDHMR